MTTNNPKNGPVDLNALFARAASQGVLSAQSQHSITDNLAGGIAGNLGNIVLAGAAGMATEDIQASEVTLITVLLDMSSSIGARGLEAAVCSGHALLLDAFTGAKEKDAVLVALWTFESTAHVLHSYVPVDQATRLVPGQTYTPRGSTHLYETFLNACAANVAYAQRLRDGGTPVKSIVVVVTDGEDVGSPRPARACKKLATDLLKSEQFHLAFVGVGQDANWQSVATSMGFPAGSILEQKDATPEGLRRAFLMVSQSAVRASQGKIAPGMAGGFFAP